MSRLLTRHRAVVARIINVYPDDSGWDNPVYYDWEYFYIDCFYQPSPPVFELEILGGGAGAPTSRNHEMIVFTKSPMPIYRQIDTYLGHMIVSDWIFIEGKWYTAYGSQEWVKMGRSSYNKMIVYYKSASHIPEDNGLVVLPFEEEYVDFIDSVGSVSNTVNLGLTNVTNIINNCKS